MAAIQHILAANQQRRRAHSQMVYINAYVRQHFSPLNVLSDRAVQSKYRLPRVEIQRLQLNESGKRGPCHLKSFSHLLVTIYKMRSHEFPHQVQLTTPKFVANIQWAGRSSLRDHEELIGLVVRLGAFLGPLFWGKIC